MSQDVGRRRSRGGLEDGSYRKDDGTDSQPVGQAVEESPERFPDPKRRRAPSPSQPAAASPSDHGATRQASEPATATTGDTTPGKAQDAETVVGNSQEAHSESSSTYFHPPGLRNERQLPSSSRTHSGSARPETSPSTQSNSVGLARLPSLSSIAQDLPVNTFPSHQSPRGLSSPISTRSNHSRHSISSRGSSPHASSSSSSSSAGRRRYGSHVTDGAVSRSASQVPDRFRYELVIHQQPGTAAAAGLSPPALSRLPIVPSPILQLRVTNAEGVDVGHRYILQNLPYLVCSCSLVSADEDQAPIDFATEEQPLPASVTGVTLARRPSQPLAMMCGTRVYSSSEAAGLDNQPGVYFIFWDISVRQEGEYRLKFSLVEALPGSPTLTTVISEPFRVVGRAEFPGTVEIATEWTRHMHRQGLNIYLPALGTSSSALASSITRS